MGLALHIQWFSRIHIYLFTGANDMCICFSEQANPFLFCFIQNFEFVRSGNLLFSWFSDKPCSLSSSQHLINLPNRVYILLFGILNFLAGQLIDVFFIHQSSKATSLSPFVFLIPRRGNLA
ncbi:hypothetical protein V8G54_001803 [Vigna mungo]|uniref:Uncharacterized protein n=1 Tax=Vigna mungo TaxID=3915 RepID=A0AAQ3S8J7_VIGMU